MISFLLQKSQLQPKLDKIYNTYTHCPENKHLCRQAKAVINGYIRVK